MENTNLKRLAAMCAAAASLSTLGLAGTAMAVETPTTADTARSAASIFVRMITQWSMMSSVFAYRFTTANTSCRHAVVASADAIKIRCPGRTGAMYIGEANFRPLRK